MRNGWEGDALHRKSAHCLEVLGPHSTLPSPSCPRPFACIRWKRAFGAAPRRAEPAFLTFSPALAGLSLVSPWRRVHRVPSLEGHRAANALLCVCRSAHLFYISLCFSSLLQAGDETNRKGGRKAREGSRWLHQERTTERQRQWRSRCLVNLALVLPGHTVFRGACSRHATDITAVLSDL